MISSLSITHAADKPTISKFKIENMTVPDAIKKLNEIIWKKYPGRKDLLVAYIDKPFPNFSFESEKIEPKKEEKHNLHLINNPPIIEVVSAISQMSHYQFEKRGSQLVVYGWSRPQIEESTPKKPSKSNQ